MNVIFDIGMVLIDFNFEDFVRKMFERDIAQKVIDAMWKSGDWGELDKGVLTDEQVLEMFISHAPECEKEIRTVFARLGECPRLREYAIPLIKDLKAKGHRVYYLSNYFSYLYHAAPWALEFIEFTDGGVFSFFENVTKPDKRIYRLLCRRFSLDPADCVFIDDTLRNVEAARELGMRGIHFTGQTPRQLKAEICR